MPALCVVGLGNPGPRYHETRHNIGFRVIERILSRIAGTEDGIAVRTQAGRTLYLLDERIVDGRPVLFVQPQTYMNASGEAIASIAGEYALAADRFLIVCDDIALPLGTLRLRRRGSSGGQNGLTSIIEALATDDIPRLRCGIGGVPDGISTADYVLSPFPAEERASVLTMIDSASDAVLSVIEDGFDRAMNRYNSAP